MKTYTLNSNQYEVKNDAGGLKVYITDDTIRHLIASNPELLHPPVTHRRRYFRPERGDNYYYLNETGAEKGGRKALSNPAVDERGVYATKEEAELADQKRLALVRLWNWADDNAPFTPDWEDNAQGKHHVVYSNRVKELLSDCKSIDIDQFTLPHFVSEEDCKRFISENEQDLLTLFTK